MRGRGLGDLYLARVALLARHLTVGVGARRAVGAAGARSPAVRKDALVTHI